ncbi:mechanosensitive ion channel family protein [Microcoleus sp. FACHB-672]|uniref:mechanosensitive ion channel family protein n=1 Tax=Microcoleus sp. FACHB-672 TaxID=2692825 RepID=UPI001685A5C2|nr:mechanosensitive ion channel family protein [Microcoleus sp. FACHB-672]MBD2042300.1 mechanosensitive ion channel family protein [Microcoleus sp. FACHB-672]
MKHWIVPVALLLIGLITGIISERVLLNKLKGFIARTKLPGNELFIQSLRGITFIWLVVAGVSGAVISLHVNGLISASVFAILQKILSSIFLYSVTIVAARLAAGFVTVLSQKVEGISASLLSNLARIVVFVFGILTILQTIGFSITPILATLGIGGLALALAFQDTLSNLFSGLYLIISRQVRTGDYVKLETGQEGYVIDITWRNTIIKEISNNVIIVPNTKLASAIFTNYHLPAKEITVPIQVGVSYHSDLERVEQVTLEVAQEVMQEVSQCVPDFKPFIRFQTFGEFSIHFTVFLRVNEFFDQNIAKHEFIKRLHKRYQQERIEIPFPSRDVYLKEKPEDS